MLRNLKDLETYTIRATDGDIGRVDDLYFDDDTWVVRYLVVDTGTWLSSRKVLISPIAIRHPDWRARTLTVSVSKEKVQDCPPIDTDKPVSRQNEAQYMGYYGYANYWGGSGIWGDGLYPYAMVEGGRDDAATRKSRDRALEAYLRFERDRHRNDNPHLRSCAAVTGYHILASDGQIGHVSGFLIDDRTWAVRFLIIDTSNWWLGHKVLLAPEWISGVHWTDHTVSVDVDRAAIRGAPPYDPNLEWSEVLERDLYHHYHRDAHWDVSIVREPEEI